MWMDMLAKVGYTEWDSLDLNHQAQVETIREEKNYQPMLENCDGVLVNNLKEETTDEEVLNLFKEVIPEEEMKNISIQPQNNPRSRLIIGFNENSIPSVWKKLNKLLIDGQMIHCHQHVPSTPPEAKPIHATKNNDVKKTEAATSIAKPNIPGLSADELTKGKKKRKRKDKKQEEKDKLNVIEKEKKNPNS